MICHKLHWRHYNEDEYEGHSPSFIGRSNLVHNRVEDGAIAGEFGSPRMPVEWLTGEIDGNGKDDNDNGFIDENLSWGSGDIDNWTGPKIGDGVDNLIFTDAEAEDVDDLDQTKEEEGDPSEFEKKKDHYNIYENELLPEDKTDENIKEYSQFEGLNDEWEVET